MMKEAQIKVLELLEAHKILVESAAILLDAMNGKTHERHHIDAQASHREIDTENPSTSQNQTSQNKHNQQGQKQTSEPSMEEMMTHTLKQVTASLRKASNNKKTTTEKHNDSKEIPIDTFSQLEKTFRDVTQKLNKYGK